MTMMMNDSTI